MNDSKNTKELIEILIKHIEKVFDIDGTEIPFNELEVKFEKRRGSICISKILYIDSNPLSGKQMKACKISYICRCGKINTILLHKYLNKRNLWCQHCVQDPTYSERVHANKKGRPKKEKEIPINLRKSFEEMDIDFKTRYYNQTPTEEQFFEYLPHIYSINDVVINSDIIKNIKYKFAVPTNNQIRFCNQISFDNGLTWKTIGKIELQCRICGKIYKIHKQNLINKKIGDFKCTYCGLQNYTYPIKIYENTNLTYQSNLELKFIEFCISNNIKIENCFEIPYIRNGKMRIYHPDFLLSDLKMIIELKGNNKFYHDDLSSGRIDAKNTAAEIFAKNHNYTFRFVLGENFDDFCNFILKERDSLNNSESELKIG